MSSANALKRMKLTFSLFATCLSASSLSPAVATATSNPDCAELSQLWQSRFIPDFNIKFATQEFSCSSFEKQIALSLYDLDKQFSDYRFGSRVDFYEVVSSRIKSLEFSSLSDPGNYSCASSIEVLARGTVETGRVTLCPFFTLAPREERASILVHESRHLDKDDPLHDNCEGGKYASMEYACDAQFHDGAWKGSGYNATVTFMAANLIGQTRNELSRSVIQGAINEAVPERFNRIAPWQIAKWRMITALFGSP